MRLRRHPCGDQWKFDTQFRSVSASPLSKPFKPRYPPPRRLLTILERNPNVLPVHAASRMTAWRKPFEQRIPCHGSLPPFHLRRTGPASMPMSNAFVALLLSETNVGMITSKRTFRSTLLEPTRTVSIPKSESLAPLVFSANQSIIDSQDEYVCAVFLSQ